VKVKVEVEVKVATAVDKRNRSLFELNVIQSEEENG
jgi:hypothetical protein